MRHLMNSFGRMAIIGLVALPVTNSMACGMCTSSDSATAGFAELGWLHIACCGALVVAGIILLLSQKLSGRGKQ